MKRLEFLSGLNKVTEEMEFNGFKIDLDFAKELKEELETQLAEQEQILYDMSDGEDISTGAKLSKFLYSLELIPSKRKEWFSFVDAWRPWHDKPVAAAKLRECFSKVDYGFGVSPDLEQLGKAYLPVNEKVMANLKTTGKAKKFVDAFLEVNKIRTWLNTNYWSIINSVTEEGFVHGNFNLCGTATGRYSSSDPNLQNLPSPKKNGGRNRVRKLIVSRYSGGFIVAPDFSQLELRVLAELTQDQHLIADYRDGIDIHADKAKMTVEKKLGIGAWDNLTDEQRKVYRNEQKTVNFALIYGRVPKKGLQKEMYEVFHEAYPKVQEWNRQVKALIERYGYYESPITGFRYNFEGATDRNYYSGYFAKGNGWKNASLNYPVQGDAGRIVQSSMVGLYEKLRGIGSIKLCGQVHDEIVIACDKKELDKVCTLCKDTMESAGEYVERFFGYKMTVPLQVEVSYGSNWFEQKEV